MISGLNTAYQGVSTIIQVIDRVAQYRAEKSRQKALRMQGQQQFLQQFMLACAPVDDEVQEAETVRLYCKKMLDSIKSHAGFIFGNGRRSPEAAYAYMGGILFHVASMPGFPPSPPAQAAVAGILSHLLLCSRVETTARIYENATTKLSDIFRLLESIQDLKFRQISVTMESIDTDIKVGFAVGANFQATRVYLPFLVADWKDATQVVAPPSAILPLGVMSCLDDATSQTNIADLVASQSSLEVLTAAYARVQNRCAEAISRSVSPCGTNRASVYSVYSECSSPVSPTFSDQVPFASMFSVPQQALSSAAVSSRSYGDGFDVPVRGNASGVDSGGWVWSDQLGVRGTYPYQREPMRSLSW